MQRKLHGKVRGRTIELGEDPGVAEGQEVELQIEVVIGSGRKWGDGILRTAGSLVDDSEWDTVMDEIYQARKVDRRQELKFE
jgi:hypothetical protein